MAEEEKPAETAAEQAHEEAPKTDTATGTHQGHNVDECRGRHQAHEDRIKSLEDALSAALQFKTDSSPVRKPWTHRGGN